MSNQYYGPVGYVNAPRPQPRNTQPVTPEMEQMLKRDDDTLSVKISPVERAKNMCTHKFPSQNNQVALVEVGRDDRGPIVNCKVCGETFHLIMSPIEEIRPKIREYTEFLTDLMQSIKAMYLDIPEEFVTQYFQSMTLVKRVEQVYDKGYKNWNQYDFNSNAQAVYNGMNSFQQVSTIIGGANMGGINPMPMGYAPMAGSYQAQQPQVFYDQNGNPLYTTPPQQYQAPQSQVLYDQFGRPVQVQTGQNGAMPMGPSTAAPAAGENPFMYNAPPAPQAAPAPTGPAPGTPQPPQAQTGDIVQTKAFQV